MNWQNNRAKAEKNEANQLQNLNREEATEKFMNDVSSCIEPSKANKLFPFLRKNHLFSYGK